jgi:hypothetical protein
MLKGLAALAQRQEPRNRSNARIPAPERCFGWKIIILSVESAKTVSKEGRVVEGSRI